MSDLMSKGELFNKLATVQTLGEAYGIIQEMPTVDAVPVVRCKDCKHWIPYDWMFSEVWQSRNMGDYSENEIGCAYCDMSMTSNDFCSRGERKDGDND